MKITMKAKTFYFIFIISLFCFIPDPAFPASGSTEWDFTLGAKGVYSAGVSDSFLYSKPYAQAKLSTDYFSIMAEAAHVFNYQITDGNGSYAYVGFNEGALGLELFPFDWLSVDTEYRYSSGDSDYINKNLFAEAELNFDNISLTGGYTKNDTRYFISSLEIKQNNYTCSGEIDYFYSDFISFDLDYTYDNVYFDNLDYYYEKHLIRAGTVPEIMDNTFLIAGLCAGLDSEDYGIYGCDIGINTLIAGHVKIILLYVFQYYSAPETTDGSGGDGSGPGHDNITKAAGTQNNPYLSTDKRGESYSSHSASAGISYVF